MIKYLNKVLSGQELDSDEIATVLKRAANFEVPHVQLGALLGAMRLRGESCAELTGGARVLRQHASFIDCGCQKVIDIVGTGGDGGISFNISTASALVAAGAGVVIAKHGNRAVSGKCGAADVMQQLGFNLEVSVPRIEYSIKTHGIGFLFAPKLHPMLAAVAAMRRELGVRTIFNLLGPLCNPAGARSMVVGVFNPNLTELFAQVLRELGAEHALIVHGLDGMDEISCCAPTRVAELKNGAIKTYDLFPELLINRRYNPSEIAGGNAQCNAQIILDILHNRAPSAHRDIVLLNAGAAIYVANLAESIADGIELAKASIDQGKAAEKLQLLIEESKK